MGKSWQGHQCLSLILLLFLCHRGTHTPVTESRNIKKYTRQLLRTKLPKETAQAMRREGAKWQWHLWGMSKDHFQFSAEPKVGHHRTRPTTLVIGQNKARVWLVEGPRWRKRKSKETKHTGYGEMFACSWMWTQSCRMVLRERKWLADLFFST